MSLTTTAFRQKVYIDEKIVANTTVASCVNTQLHRVLPASAQIHNIIIFYSKITPRLLQRRDKNNYVYFLYLYYKNYLQSVESVNSLKNKRNRVDTRTLEAIQNTINIKLIK